MCNCTVCYANNVSQFNERIGILDSPQLDKTVLLLEYWCAPRLMLFYHTKIKNDQYTEIPTSMAISCHLRISVVMCKCSSTSISVCSSAYVSILNKSYANINVNQFNQRCSISCSQQLCQTVLTLVYRCNCYLLMIPKVSVKSLTRCNHFNFL